ncbi:MULTISPECIES: permease [unclassified Microcystis]|uniref:permease n=1 Tax=unclassified Microcystis TaxID=2643300 RepID=UPI0022C0ED07|nr:MULTISPECIES: permease [unclassified Microcystis]MCA2692359.1 permease [Microcystis sp. M034S2]MCA2749311.1 permease [Microcystis sp. M144S2]MCZ8199354.1 permease [Microcystis sp. LE19-55.1A]MCZ8306846.1 permease [Microcystis sp. LE19-98.1E]
MSQLQNAFTLFLSLLVEAMPFLLLGVILSSILLIFVDERRLVALMPRNAILGAFVGGCIGFLFPVCECGNVPVARRLLVQGMPNAVAVSFLLAAPTINPIVIWSTWVAFRDQPEIVFYRVIFSLFIATVIGIIFSIQKDPRPLLQTSLAKSLNWQPETPEKESIPLLLQSGSFLIGNSGKTLRLDESFAATAVLPAVQAIPMKKRWLTFLENVVMELRELGGVLILGSAIAAGLQVFVPREFVLNLGQDPITSILAMMLLAVIVSICSTVDSFFALSFASSFTSSSLLAFLVFGPMIDLKGIGLMLSIFKPRMLIYLFALAAQMTFLLTLAHSYLF